MGIDVITLKLKRKRKLVALAFSLLVLFPFLQVLLLAIPSTVFAAEFITDTDHGGANFTLADGDVIAGNQTNIATFTIPIGATVSVKDYNGTIYGSVTVSATTIVIDGTLTATGKGFSGGASGAAGSGPGGGGVCSGSSGGAGGGYGGAGGSASGATGGSTYGSSTEPTDKGSGGGGSCGSGSTSGGDGGGAIKLTATGTITVDGTVESNGGDGSSATFGGGAGSGGSIHFIAATLAGSGSVLAAGGDGGSGSSEAGAGGGGGRISLQFTSSDTLSGSGTISAAAGSPGSPGSGSIDGQETRTTALDVMTRQKISENSDHSISFGIPEGVDASSDTITITFAVGFDLSSITISDVDFEGGGIARTLAASPAAGVWGYSRSGQTITFTAPTDAGSNEITANGAVDIEIGEVAAGGSNQIVNPSTVGTYSITIGGDLWSCTIHFRSNY